MPSPRVNAQYTGRDTWASDTRTFKAMMTCNRKLFDPHGTSAAGYTGGLPFVRNTQEDRDYLKTECLSARQSVLNDSVNPEPMRSSREVMDETPNSPEEPAPRPSTTPSVTSFWASEYRLSYSKKNSHCNNSSGSCVDASTSLRLPQLSMRSSSFRDNTQVRGKYCFLQSSPRTRHIQSPVNEAAEQSPSASGHSTYYVPSSPRSDPSTPRDYHLKQTYTRDYFNRPLRQKLFQNPVPTEAFSQRQHLKPHSPFVFTSTYRTDYSPLKKNRRFFESKHNQKTKGRQNHTAWKASQREAGGDSRVSPVQNPDVQ